MGKFTQWLLAIAVILLGIYGWKIIAVDIWEVEVSEQDHADADRTATLLHER
jgi:hypothetical protein